LSQKMGVEELVTFEMLEGMANHLPRVMRSLNKHIILYTPVVKNEHFLNAISYLVRRMDENTSKDNFLSYSFNLKFGSKQWEFLKDQFLKAYELKDKMEARSFRTQDRNKLQASIITEEELNTFRNEPDTNFDLKPNRLWADKIREQWKKSSSDEPYQMPVQIGDKQYTATHKKAYYDRSQAEDVCLCEVSLSSMEQVKELIDVAEADASNWRKTSLDERNRILHQVALKLSAQRGNLIGCMCAITGKTIVEGDVEVSEAIDFCRYYPITMKSFAGLETITCTPKGIILVIPPWNFPLSIPVGGTAAALAGGNTVILKPATVAFPVAWEFAKCFWEAGVPKDALQVVCTDGREPLNFLTTHPAIKHVILTGGTETAFKLLENNPVCPLSAETGGKNAIILTSSGDRDHAIQNVVASAFSNAGQKCSACSLLLLAKDNYNDPEFKSKLKDAVTSMHTGSVWNGGNVVGPMITNDNEKLLHAINNLEPGESWLVKPEFADEKHYMLKPCVKWGVKPGSYSFQNELFAPMLSVVCMEDLEEGIKLVNSTGYGLTSGIQSLDESEQIRWKNEIEAGNLYINRGITGAIVHRQPFGGMKRSAFGGGIKAGWKNYVSCFVNMTEKQLPTLPIQAKAFESYTSALNPIDKIRFETAVSSYLENWGKEFSKEVVTERLIGELDTFRYLPLKKMVFRINTSDTLCDCFMIMAAAKIVKTALTVSICKEDEKLDAIRQCAEKDFPVITQADAEFLSGLEAFDRIRTCCNEKHENLYRMAATLGKHIAGAKPLPEGRIELLNYVKEQSISFEYHRYGSITEPVEC
ncbi:MAG: proline dehydrogenase family protein, partial [Bacteroidota bacterium]|nr:proline dehydrogenase family protein [Bacteroidota bacterium]